MGAKVTTEHITLPTAFIAGLLSFFSPCVLPLVPIYLGYMTGTTASTVDDAQRFKTLTHALAFTLGFGLVFVVLGGGMGLLGSVIYPIMPYVIKLGGLLLIVFGLNMMGLISIPFLSMEKRFELSRARKKNYWTSFLIGIVFAVGWTPCIGPVLSAILLLAADSRTLGTGALLLTIYAVGLGLPFLIVAGLVDVATPALKRLNRYLRLVSIIGGVLLLLMGLLLITGLFETLVFRLASLTS
jgi:cytochrome c-type biogenesis protein